MQVPSQTQKRDRDHKPTRAARAKRNVWAHVAPSSGDDIVCEGRDLVITLDAVELRANPLGAAGKPHA